MASTIHIDYAALHACEVHLISDVEGSHQHHSGRRVSIVELGSDGLVGFGEVVGLDLPNYSSEWSRGSDYLLRRLILPEIIERRQVGFHSLDWLVGNGASRFALECAILDLLAKRAGKGITDYLAVLFESDSYLPSRKLSFGVSIGTLSGYASALSEIERASRQGVRRIKLKVNKNRALEFIDKAFDFDPLEVVLDFNGSLSPDDLGLMRELENRGLSFVEEPTSNLGLIGYGELSRSFDIRIFLDETASSQAVVNDLPYFADGLGFVVKPYRFGSLFSLHRALEVLAEHGIACYAGGMFEASIGRRFLLAFASHRCFTETGDMAPSGWYYDRDLGPPVIPGEGENFLSPQFEFGTDVAAIEGHSCTNECITLM
ncbi:MAG: hypothetical protein EPN30_09445 [Actinomycetota bacterium]|nr:MAG: hypothetical protein EPN30_09445 [Actinomycetota bacterium]